jgi:hypothetical protein
MTMPVSTDCRTAITEALAEAGPGLTLNELMAQLLAYHAPQAVCDTLGAAVRDGAVALAYQDVPEEREALLFRLAVAPGPVTAEIHQAAEDLVHYLGSRTDNRGDDHPIANPAAIFKALEGKHAVPALEAAFQLAFSEQLLWPVARSSNSYVTVTLSQHRVYTVLAYDRTAQQAEVFHVRGGSEAVVLHKLAEAKPQLQRLALVPGRVPLRAADLQLPLAPHSL